MRIAALLLLAFAFSRPFWRSGQESKTATEGRRVIVLVDTSASMQRPGAWESAKENTRRIVDELDLVDVLAVASFDSETKLWMGFDESMQLATEDRGTRVSQILDTIEPSWLGTNLGTALRFAGDYATEIITSSGDEHPEATKSVPTQIYLVSDFQSGSELGTLQSYAWPEGVRVMWVGVKATTAGNASAQILGEDTRRDNPGWRVRVSNSSDSTVSSLALRFDSATANTTVNPAPRAEVATRTESPSSVTEVSVQIPPGEMRIVHMPFSNEPSTALRLVGDPCEFDNQWRVAPPRKSVSEVIFIGTAESDPRQSLWYYLQLVPLSRRHHEVVLTQRTPESLVTGLDVQRVSLVIVADRVGASGVEWLRSYVAAGGRVLWVLGHDDLVADARQDLSQLIDAPEIKVNTSSVKDYSLLTNIDFTHRLFRPLADARFNDFSKLRVWKHRRLESLPIASKELVQFDDGDPALVEMPRDNGFVFLLTFGWNPSESQLALSTKFIPLLTGLALDHLQQKEIPTTFLVGDPVPEGWANMDDSMAADGRFIKPGVFLHDGAPIAVNLDPRESDTFPLGLETLERMGVSIGKTETFAEKAQRERKVLDTELERRQNLWQWAIMAVLGLVGLESIVSGLKSRAT
jgi:hypothetical protein